MSETTSASPSAPPASMMPSSVASSAAAVSSAVSSAAQSVKSKIPEKAILIVSIALLTIVIAGIVGAIIYFAYKKLAVRINNYTLPESKMPSRGTEYKKMSGNEIPTPYNGNRMTMSFWLYINDINKFAGSYRHVFHRGSDTSMLNASPLVFLDKSSNKLHIRFEDKSTPTAGLSITRPYDNTVTDVPVTSDTKWKGTISNADIALAHDLSSHGITIDYIPLQRWVHVAVVVNEDVNGGFIGAYLDSELVKHVQTGMSFRAADVTINGRLTTDADTVAAQSKQLTIANDYKLNTLKLDGPGDIHVGGGDNVVGPGFSGLISTIAFANHDMNAEDIYNMYMLGPVDNLAAKLGLPAYGMRTPIYRIT